MNALANKIEAARLDTYVQAIDCRAGLKTLADNSISLVLTDPPYFIDGMGDDWDDGVLQRRAASAGVVGGLPAGMKFDVAQSRDLRKFLTPIAREWMRVTKPGGFVLCFMQPRLAHSAAIAMEDAGIEIRDAYVWQRNGQAKAFTQDHFVKKRKNLAEHEKAKIIEQLGGRKTAQLRPNNETIIMGQIPCDGTLVDNWLKWKTGLIDVSNPLLSPNSFPSTIMSSPKPTERHGHMTAKPVPLLRHLIRIFCPDTPESCVLDNFAGCGSTGEAAILEERAFIGFEIETEYASRANARINAVVHVR